MVLLSVLSKECDSQNAIIYDIRLEIKMVCKMVTNSLCFCEPWE